MWLALSFLTHPVAGQQGDRAGEPQPLLPASVDVPSAEARDPLAERESFRVRDGLDVRLFASEPDVGDPVAAAFDAAGRMWVVEMRGFMRDIQGTDERAPTGRVVVLADHDGDGRCDESTVFLGGLVLPRAVLPLRGGALVLEPPHLHWCPDRDGDLHADAKEAVLGGFEAGLDNPEHCGNGLLWGLDHRIHLANDARVLRWTPSGFLVEAVAGGGQWGITQDDRGRRFFNYNEDWLRCDLLPPRYGPRGQVVGGLPGLNHRVCEDRTVWPARLTPGVNRGYQPGRLRDYVLAIHTAVCGPAVYRGDLLPGCDGDVFVCEPAGNVVRRIVLQDGNGQLRGANPHEQEQLEFLASTDERFRPVNLLGGPDGALYVVDMYRGVIQHRNFVTSYLRDQIERRGLDRPTGLGRIWRIGPAGEVAPARVPSLSDAPPHRLVEALASPVGAVRDVALREIVQRQERGVAGLLRERLRAHGRPACRIALLSALQGLGVVGATDLRHALHDPDPGVVAFALQQTAPFLTAGDGHLWVLVEDLVGSEVATVRWHVALALGDVLAEAAADRYVPRALGGLARLAARGGDDAILRGAVVLAAHPRTVQLLAQLVAADPAEAQPGILAMMRDLARGAVRSRDAEAQVALFGFAAGLSIGWQQKALLRGAAEALPRAGGHAGWLRFRATPSGLVQLARSGEPQIARLATELLAAVALPEPAADLADEAAHDAAGRERIARGARVYAQACAACHQPDGLGLQGMAPPLRDSQWVLGPVPCLVRIVLHGLRGPIEVDGVTWDLEMPGHRHLGDAELAQALSYVRAVFGPRASTVAPEEVAALRRSTGNRTEPWTAEELLGTK